MQADSQMSKDRQVFYDASLQYVFKIQEVQERKKFEFVEPVSARIVVWTVFTYNLQCDFILTPNYFKHARFFSVTFLPVVLFLLNFLG